MATLVEIAEAIETRLRTITGLNTAPAAQGQITPPCALVDIPTIDYRITMGRGKANLPFTVTVLTSQASDLAGIRMLLDFADRTGSSSVIEAIEADKTLGGTVDDCVVWDYRRLGLDEVGVIGYFGGVFDLRVVADGS